MLNIYYDNVPEPHKSKIQDLLYDLAESQKYYNAEYQKLLGLHTIESLYKVNDSESVEDSKTLTDQTFRVCESHSALIDIINSYSSYINKHGLAKYFK